MLTELQAFFKKNLYPAVTIILLVKIAQSAGWLTFRIDAPGRVFEVGLLLIAVCSALLSPFLYRIYFIGQYKNQQYTPERAFVRFQKNTLSIAVFTSYLFILTLVYTVAPYIQISILLLTLYAAYFYYPSKKRLTFEVKLFRVKKADE